MGAFFRFLGLCVCLGVQRGLGRVLIKYSGNVRLQMNESKITDMPTYAYKVKASSGHHRHSAQQTKGYSNEIQRV